jgi:hypothetical protein
MCGPEPPSSCPDGCAQCTPQLPDDGAEPDRAAEYEQARRERLAATRFLDAGGRDRQAAKHLAHYVLALTACSACSTADHAHCARRTQLPGDMGWLAEGCCCGVLAQGLTRGA